MRITRTPKLITRWAQPILALVCVCFLANAATADESRRTKKKEKNVVIVQKNDDKAEIVDELLLREQLQVLSNAVPAQKKDCTAKEAYEQALRELSEAKVDYYETVMLAEQSFRKNIEKATGDVLNIVQDAMKQAGVTNEDLLKDVRKKALSAYEKVMALTRGLVSDIRGQSLLFARAEAKAKLAPEPPEQVVKVLRPSYAKVAVLSKLIAALKIPDLTVSADLSTNVLVVAGPKEAQEKVLDVINLLDVPRVERPEDQQITRIYDLKHAKPDKYLRDALHAVIDMRRDKLAFFERHNQVLVQTDVKTAQLVEQVLAELDKPPKVMPAPTRGRVVTNKPAPQSLRVRVVWLVSGLKREAPLPPDDLQGAVDELAKIGVKDLRLVSQNIVQTLPGQRFELSSLPMLDIPCALHMKGEIVEDSGSYKLNIILYAKEQLPDGGEKDFTNLQTLVAAPPGHVVVLAAAPVGELTSVFIVQVTPSKTGEKLSPGVVPNTSKPKPR